MIYPLEGSATQDFEQRLPPILRKFYVAWCGLREGYRAEQSLRVQLAIGILALLAGLAVGLTRLEWLFLIAAVGAVLSLELVNSGIEKTLDLVHPGYHENVRFVKDVMAAAVLVVAVAAVAGGLLIFVPHFL